MNKKIVLLCVFGALLLSSAVYAQNYTGTGGRGVNLAVLSPTPNGLSADQAYLPTMVQGVFVSDLKKYSAMSVIDRENLEKVLQETESGVSREADFVKLGEINADHTLRGSLTRTSSGFSLQIQITGLKDGKVKASYSGACTVAELDNYVAIKKASLDLLGQMGVTLTAQARAELQQAASPQTIQGQTNLAQGITAQRQGRETEAMSFFSQANIIDPSLLEAASRLNVLSRNVSSGSIGADARNDVQWRKDWIARLTEAEQYFDRFFKTYNQPYVLIQLTGLEHGKTDYQTESMPISFKVDFRESDAGRWTGAVTAAANPVLNGLNQTRKKSEWGLDRWPRSRVSNVAPFDDGRKRFSIVAELLNDKNKVIGTQPFNTSGSWSFNFNSGISMSTSSSGVQTITFPRVKVDDITDRMTIRFASVDNKAADAVAKSGVLQITTQADYRDAEGFNYDGGGYSWAGYNKDGYDKDGYNRFGYTKDGFNKEGYDRSGYARDGFNKEGWDKAGYTRDGYDKYGFNKAGYTVDGASYDTAGYDSRGFNKEGYTVDGSLYDTAGYDRNGYDKTGYNKDGYDKKGYGRDGYNRNGIKRWSPVPASTSFELLGTLRLGSSMPAGGVTVGLFGAYGSFSIISVKSDEPTDNSSTVNEETTNKKTSDYLEYVVGYTLNLQSKKGANFLSGWGLPLGIGYNTLENQLVMEIGLQLRGTKMHYPKTRGGVELRGTYRLIGFRDHGATISFGWW
jgi:tetratricopeptide (TPR) repeat protein